MKRQTTTSLLSVGILLLSSYSLFYECNAHLRGSNNEFPSGPNNEEKINLGATPRSLQLAAEWPHNGKRRRKIKVMNSLCREEYFWFFKTAISEWSLSKALKFKCFRGKCGNKTYNKKFIKGVVKVVNEDKPDVGWSGLTSYKYKLVENEWKIGAIIIIMNDHYLLNDAMSTSTYYHRRQNMCHELGHAIGLGHPDLDHNNRNIGSCMDYSAYPQGGMHRGQNFGGPNLVPSAKDYELITKAYPIIKSRKLQDEEDESSSEDYNSDEEDIFKSPDQIEFESIYVENIFETSDFNDTFDATDILDLDDVGIHVNTETRNGNREERYEKFDEERGTLIVTVKSGISESYPH